MGPTSTYFVVFLATYFAVIQTCMAVSAFWTPLELCEILKNNFLATEIPDCAQLDPKALEAMAANLEQIGFDPSNPKDVRILSKLFNLGVKTVEDESPGGESEEDGVAFQPRPTRVRLQDMKRPFLPPELNILTHNVKFVTPKTTEDVYQSTGFVPRGMRLLDESVRSRRQAAPDDKEESQDNGEPSNAEKQRLFLQRRLPKNRLRNLYRSGFDMSNLYASLLFESAIEKIYEIQMAQYFA